MAEPYTKTTRSGATFSHVKTEKSGANEQTSVTSATTQWTNTLNGWKNPQWKEQVRRHVQAGTTMTAVEQYADVQTGRLKVSGWTNANQNPASYRSAEYRGTFHLGAYFKSIPGGQLDSAASSAAASAFYKEIAKRKREIQSGVVVGEARESARMIANRSQSMLNLFPSWRKRMQKSKRAATRGKKGVKAYLKDAGNAWLEFSFGWDPLANDIRSALETWVKPRREVSRISRRAAASGVPIVVNSSTVVGPMRINTMHVEKVETSVAYYGALRAEVDVSQEANGYERWGLRPHEFIPSLYELLPWSWLIDYFTNLGDVVNAFYSPRSDLVWTSMTRVRSTDVLRVTNCAPGPSLVAVEGVVSHAPRERFVVRNVSRTPGVSIPVPELRFQTDFRPRRLLNLAGLYAARRFKPWY